MEYVPNSAGLRAVFTGELILVAPDPDDPHLVDPSFDPSELIPLRTAPECVGRGRACAMAWCPGGGTLTLCTGGTLISMTKEFHVLAGARRRRRRRRRREHLWRGDGQFMATLVAA